MIHALVKLGAFLQRDFLSEVSYRLAFLMQVGGIFLSMLAFYYVTGMIDPRAVASGLSVLCSGPRDAKVRAAFDLFDINGDGFISLDEMLKYLSAVFKVLYVATPGMQIQLVVSAEELALMTTEQVFEQCDTNQDDRLSFKEFKQWYTDSGPVMNKKNNDRSWYSDDDDE